MKFKKLAALAVSAMLIAGCSTGGGGTTAGGCPAA